MTTIPKRPLPTIYRSLRAHRRATLPGSGLYAYLRTRATAAEHPVFDIGMFWSNSAACLEAGRRYRVIVYALFQNADSLNDFADKVEYSLAIDAEVYRSVSTGECTPTYSMALLFSYVSPLIGPMSYGEVESAVKHYLGWCPRLSENDVPWADAKRITAELVPREEVSEWFKARDKALAVEIETKEFFVGIGFSCEIPCDGKKAEDEELQRPLQHQHQDSYQLTLNSPSLL